MGKEGEKRGGNEWKWKGVGGERNECEGRDEEDD